MSKFRIKNSKQWTHDQAERCPEAIQDVKIGETIYDIPMKYFRPGVIPDFIPRYSDRPSPDGLYLEQAEWLGRHLRELGMHTVTLDIEPDETDYWRMQTHEQRMHAVPSRGAVVTAFRRGFNPTGDAAHKIGMAWVQPVWFDVSEWLSKGRPDKSVQAIWKNYQWELDVKPLLAALDWIDSDHYYPGSTMHSSFAPALVWKKRAAKWIHGGKELEIHIALGNTYKSSTGETVFYEYLHAKIKQELEAIRAAGLNASVWSWSDAVWSPELIALLESLHDTDFGAGQ